MGREKMGGGKRKEGVGHKEERKGRNINKGGG